MDRQPRVLQERVQADAIIRHWRHPGERVGAEDQEGEKPSRGQALHRDCPRPQARGQGLSEPDHGRPEQRHDHDPEQHRAFMIAPGAAELVDHRLARMRMRRHQLDAEIRDHEGVSQYRKSENAQQSLGDRAALGKQHRPAITNMRAMQPQPGL